MKATILKKRFPAEWLKFECDVYNDIHILYPQMGLEIKRTIAYNAAFRMALILHKQMKDKKPGKK